MFHLVNFEDMKRQRISSWWADPRPPGEKSQILWLPRNAQTGVFDRTAYSPWFMVGCPAMPASWMYSSHRNGIPHPVEWSPVILFFNLLKWPLGLTDEIFWRLFKKGGMFGLRSFLPLWLDGHFCFEIRMFSVMNASLTHRWVGISRMANVPNTGCVSFKLDSDTLYLISL